MAKLDCVGGIMKVRVLPIVSKLHHGEIILEDTKKLLKNIKETGQLDIQISEVSSLYQGDLAIILVQSGGSEGEFLTLEKSLKPPYYLLTYGSNNSLAASMEILSYLKSKGEEAEILHGSVDYIVERINALVFDKKPEPMQLGVLGKPSDWLIASSVNYQDALKRLNISLVDISIDELVETFHQMDPTTYEKSLSLPFDYHEIDQAKKVSMAFEAIIEKYRLKGLTVRCFDLLSKIQTTGCLGLSLLNRNKIIGTCEGDIPAMISMYLMKEITNQPGFQANPSRIDTDQNQIVFAHCTLPFDMAEDYAVMTHYESGIGVALRGKMKETDITVFKLSNNLKDYYVSEGKIIENLEEAKLCRTQIKIQLSDVRYFLTSPYGNHHIIIYGHHKERIESYMSNF